MKISLFQNVYKKLVAVVAAVVIWAIVSQSITTSRVFARVPVRIVNLPQDKTIRGLMPNGTLDRKISLTLTGRRDTIDQMTSSDFEVVIDASGMKGDDWIIELKKKNLVSLNPDIDLIHNITSVTHNKFALHLSRLIAEKIPIYFSIPQGEPPDGYQFLDILPQKVTHTVSGPEEDVKELVEKGIELTFTLSSITKEELDNLQAAEGDQRDEVSYPVPDSWKKVQIPFLGGTKQEINGPEAKNLKIVFLRKELLSLKQELPLRVFFPVSTIATLNPEKCPIITSKDIQLKNGIMLITKHLYVSEVSRLFLDVVSDRMEVVLTAAVEKGMSLRSDIQFIDPEELEDRYVNILLVEESTREGNGQSNFTEVRSRRSSILVEKERYLRDRFRDYMQKIRLFLNKDQPFQLNAQYNDGTIILREF